MSSSAASRRMLSAPRPSRSTSASAALVMASRERFPLDTWTATPYSVRYDVRAEGEGHASAGGGIRAAGYGGGARAGGSGRRVRERPRGLRGRLRAAGAGRHDG